LAKAMIELLSNPDIARQMGQAGRAFVERELTVGRLVDEHDRLYRQIARPQGAALGRPT
jgi:glycosyltransferase involved in cell wall biosynthesis